MNVNVTADRPPACETYRSSEGGEVGGKPETAFEAMRVYTEIAKNSEQFYEDAFNQIVIILGGVGVVIAIFLFSEHKSFEDMRTRAESRIDNLVGDAVEQAREQARQKFDEMYEGLIKDVKDLIKDVKAVEAAIRSTKGLAASAAEAMSMQLIGMYSLLEGQLKERRVEDLKVEDPNLAKRDFENAVWALEIAEKFWGTPDILDQPEARRMLAHLRARLAYAKKRLGDFRGSLDLIEKALEHFPDNPSLLYNGGCYAALLGLRDRSLNYFRRCIEIEPSYRDKLRTELGIRTGPGSETGDAKNYKDDRDFRAVAGLD